MKKNKTTKDVYVAWIHGTEYNGAYHEFLPRKQSKSSSNKTKELKK